MPTILGGKDDTTAGGGAVVVSVTAATAVVILLPTPRSFCASVVNFGMYFLSFKFFPYIFKRQFKKNSVLVGLNQELCFFVFSQYLFWLF